MSTFLADTTDLPAVSRRLDELASQAQALDEAKLQEFIQFGDVERSELFLLLFGGDSLPNQLQTARSPKQWRSFTPPEAQSARG